MDLRGMDKSSREEYLRKTSGCECFCLYYNNDIFILSNSFYLLFMFLYRAL